MSIEKARNVVRALAARTAENAVTWTETSKANSFQVSLKSTSVVLERRDRGDHTYDFTVYFINEEGAVVEDMTDEDLCIGWNEGYKVLVSLFDAARSQALGVDQTLDDMIRELDSLADIPF